MDRPVSAGPPVGRRGRRRRRQRRQRVAALGIVAVLVCVVALVVVLRTGGEGGSRARTTSRASAPRPAPSVAVGPMTVVSTAPATVAPPTTEPPTTSPPTTAPPPSPPAAAGQGLRGLPVSTTTLSFVDSSRPVVTGGATVDSARRLPTIVYVPQGPSGPLPLVVFAHGYQLGPSDYERVCRQMASAGYVVAAPSFPLADATRGNGLDRDDLPNEATDVSFVITALLDSSIGQRLDPSHIAVVGHSDGADVALMVGYQSGKVDPRVGAVVAMSPDAMTGPIAAGGPPLLLEHGDADTIVPYSNSTMVFDQVGAPRWFLTLHGADHLPAVAGQAPWADVLDAVIADFLDATTGHRVPSLEPKLSNDVGSSGVASIDERG